MAKDSSVSVKLTLSPTKVDTFYGCKRRFKYSYVNKPFVPVENKYFLIGNVIHKVLEEFHKVNPIDKSEWKPLLNQIFKKTAATYKLKEKLGTKISYEDLESMKEMVKNYRRYLSSLEDLPQIHSIEKLSKLVFDKGIVCWMKSDRIDKIGDSFYKVVDYKTGRPASNSDELSSVQIPSYGLLIRMTVDKDARIVGEYQYIKHLGTKSGVHKHIVTDDMMEAAKEKYVKVFEEIASGKCQFTQNFKYKYCGNCDFRSHCMRDKSNDY